MKLQLSSGQTKLIQLLCCLFIFGLAFFLRVHHLAMRVSFNGDTGRHFLVAKHFFVDPDVNRSMAPYAEGGIGDLENSPFYYWYRAILYAVGGRSIITNAQIAVALDSLGIFAAIGIGSLLLDANFGLVLGLAFAIQPEFIQNSQLLFQPFFITPIILFGIFFLLFSIKKKQTWSFLISWILLLISASIHLAALALVPSYLFLFILLFVQSYKKHSRKNACLFVFGMTLSSIVYAYSINFSFGHFFHWVETIGNHQAVLSKITPSSFTVLTRIDTIINQIFRLTDASIWDANFSRLQSVICMDILLAIILIGCISFFFSYAKKKWFLANTLFLLFFSIPVLFMMQKYDSWYSVCQTIIGLIIVCYELTLLFDEGISLIRSKSNVFRSVLLGILLLIWFLPKTLEYFNSTPVVSDLDAISETSQSILDSLQIVQPETPVAALIKQAMIVDRTDYDLSLESPSLWYFLEEKTGTNLVQICDDGLANCARVQRPKYFFLICQFAELDCPTHVFAWTRDYEQAYALNTLRIPSEFLPPGNFPHLQKVPLSTAASQKFQLWMAWE